MPLRHFMALLTFSYLRDLQKKERASRKPEKLPAGFFNSLKEYIARAKSQGAGKPEIESALPVIKSLIERREQKVLELASMSVSAGVAPENLLPEEKELFEEACAVLARHRAGAGDIFGEKGKKEKHKDEAQEKEGEPKKPEEQEVPEEKQEKAQLEIVRDVPSFIAEDLRAHGPWRQGESAECPPKAAKVLVDNGYAKYL